MQPLSSGAGVGDKALGPFAASLIQALKHFLNIGARKGKRDVKRLREKHKVFYALKPFYYCFSKIL